MFLKWHDGKAEVRKARKWVLLGLVVFHVCKQSASSLRFSSSLHAWCCITVILLNELTTTLSRLSDLFIYLYSLCSLKTAHQNYSLVHFYYISQFLLHLLLLAFTFPFPSCPEFKKYIFFCFWCLTKSSRMLPNNVESLRVSDYGVLFESNSKILITLQWIHIAYVQLLYRCSRREPFEADADGMSNASRKK